MKKKIFRWLKFIGLLAAAAVCLCATLWLAGHWAAAGVLGDSDPCPLLAQKTGCRLGKTQI